jgi:hypothetical protein
LIWGYARTTVTLAWRSASASKFLSYLERLFGCVAMNWSGRPVGPVAVTLGRKASEVPLPTSLSVDKGHRCPQCGGKENYQDDGAVHDTRQMFFEYEWSVS